MLSLVSYPELIHTSDFPEDVKIRAVRLLSTFRGETIGSYSPSAGCDVVREHVAEYIQKRDGGRLENPDNIIFCNGASDAIRVRHYIFHN